MALTDWMLCISAGIFTKTLKGQNWLDQHSFFLLVLLNWTIKSRDRSFFHVINQTYTLHLLVLLELSTRSQPKKIIRLLNSTLSFLTHSTNRNEPNGWYFIPQLNLLNNFLASIAIKKKINPTKWIYSLYKQSHTQWILQSITVR